MQCDAKLTKLYSLVGDLPDDDDDMASDFGRPATRSVHPAAEGGSAMYNVRTPTRDEYQFRL